MARCQICSKKSVVGKKVSHSSRKTSRSFGANVQKITVKVGGLKIKMRLCTRCIKKMRNQEKEEKKNGRQISKPNPQKKVSKS